MPDEMQLRHAGIQVLKIGSANLLEMSHDVYQELAVELQLGAEELRKLAEAGAEHAAFHERWQDATELHLTLVQQLNEETSGRSYLGAIQGQINLGDEIEPEYTVQMEGRSFTAFPSKKANDTEIGMDMTREFDDNWMDLPCAWKPYEACKDFERIILPEVIGGHSWGTDMMMVKRGTKWPGFQTGIQGASGAGKRICSHVDWFEVDASGRRCVWRGEDPVRTPSKKLDPFWRSWGGRLLLEKIPQQQRIDMFKVFLQTTAITAWSKMQCKQRSE